MNVTPQQFEGMLPSVVQSQESEVTLAKQPVMADYGREVRAIVSALPPEVSAGLLNSYQPPAPPVMAAMEGAIAARELAADHVSQNIGVDQTWLAQPGAGRAISENQMGARDDWNSAPSA